MAKRIFLLVLDGLGIGALPDAHLYNDSTANTLQSVAKTAILDIPNLTKLGLFNIDTVAGNSVAFPLASYARMQEQAVGKDTTAGHWELAGLIKTSPAPTYPNGFPATIINQFTKKTKRQVLCNQPYSGTQAILDYGAEHMRTGALIVYTSADSVFQIAAHQDIVPLEVLYDYCKIARGLLQGEHGVGRVIARPFAGQYPNFFRTKDRKDYSLPPEGKTALDIISNEGGQVISIGKIAEIFAQKGISRSLPAKDNAAAIAQILKVLKQDFYGLCFANLIDFDSLYGHRNDSAGYAKALNKFDAALQLIIERLQDKDILILTADHGCDPGDISTDHTREYTPMLIYGKQIKQGINLNTRSSFADIGATVLEALGCKDRAQGQSFYKEVAKLEN